MAGRRLLRKHLGFEFAARVAAPAILAGFATLPASGELAVLVGIAVATVAFVVWLLVTDPTAGSRRSQTNATPTVVDGDAENDVGELEVGGLFDEGVAAPNGDEFTVIARPRRLPVIGSSLVTSAIFGDQYEVRVRPWPHRVRGDVQWSGIVPTNNVLTLADELVQLLKRGEWRPGDGEPPLAPMLRTSLDGPH